VATERETPANPWMIGLTVLWCSVLAVAIIFAMLGGNAGSLTYDEPGLPPSDVLAGIYYACSGIAVAVAVLLVGVQVGVGALRWYLDPASRTSAAPATPAEGDERPVRVRQDF